MPRNMLSIAAVTMAMLAGYLCFGSVSANETQQKQAKADGKTSRTNGATLDLNDVDSKSSELRSVIERYTSDRGSLLRFYSVEASVARQTRMKQFYNEWLTSLTKLDFDRMSQDGRIDYLLFKNHLEHELRQLDLQSRALAEVAPLIPFAQTITDLEDSRRRMEAIASPKIASLFTRMSKQIDATSKAVEVGLKAD